MRERERDVEFHVGEQIKTRGILGRKGKEDPQQLPHEARTPTTKRGEDEKCLLDFGSERSTTRIGGQQLHLHEILEKLNE